MSVSFPAHDTVAGQSSRSATASQSENFAGCVSAGDSDDQRAEFRTWMAKYFQKGISEDRRREVTEYAAEFETLMDKAGQADADARPLEFVRSLSTGEREVLRHIHGLADSVNPAALSEEGALNLLRSPGSAKDIDRDGFQMVGAAKIWTFPPPDAPAAVKQAWEETTRGLSEADVMLLQGSFLPIRVPGQPSTSAYWGAETDYSKLAEKVLESAEFSRSYDQPWQVSTRDRQIELLQALIERLKG